MDSLEDKIYHGYVCQTGCGHTTLTDKYYKTRRTRCAVCGVKTEMQYQGEFKITKQPDPNKINLNLTNSE